MPDNTPTDEQVKRLLKRWRKFYNKMIVPFQLIQASLIYLYFFLWRLNLPVFVPLLCAVSTFPIIFLGIRYVRYKFVRQMTRAERNVLESCSYSSLSHMQTDTLLMLRKVYDKVTPKDVLLRPSQEPQDDTLLRAAQYTEEKAQEQLLRPTDTP